MIEDPYTTAMLVWGIFGWLMYFRESERSSDYAADLAQAIYDHNLTTDDLRRSVKWDEIRAQAKKNEQ